MRLRLRLARAGSGPEDIVVMTEPDGTVGGVARAIRDRDPTAATAGHPTGEVTLGVERDAAAGALVERLAADALLSDAPIGPGDTVRIVGLEDDSAVQSDDMREAPRGVLLVVAGPSAGLRFRIRGGSAVIGRDPDCEIVLADSSVSRRHARVEVADTIELVDLGSANGLVVDGELVTRVRLSESEPVWLGESAVVLRPPVVSAPRVAPARAARTVRYNRSPRVEPRYPGRSFTAPDVPGLVDRPRFPWAALAVPLLMGAAVLLLPGSAAFRLIFIAFAPLAIAGAFIARAVEQRRAERAAMRRFDAELGALDDLLAEAVAVERAVRDAEAPRLETLVDAVRRADPPLWARRPEHWNHLHVRLGTGRVRSRNTVSEGRTTGGRPEPAARLRAMLARHAEIDGLPLVDALDSAGAIGIAGGAREGAAAALLLQIAALHAPSDLVIAGIVDRSGAVAFDWLRHLPHVDAAGVLLDGPALAESGPSAGVVLSELEALVERRRDRTGTTSFGAIADGETAMHAGGGVGRGGAPGPAPPEPALLVLIGTDAPIDHARLVRLIESGPAAGVYALWLARSAAELPAACRTYLEVDASVSNGSFEPGGRRPGTVGLVRAGLALSVAIDTLAPNAASEVAFALGRVIDVAAGPEGPGELASSVSLGALLGAEMVISPGAILDRWRENDSVLDRDGPPGPRRRVRLHALVGRSIAGPMRLDLRADGPHALVGGTTGSGKSEFLRAWVLGMAAELSPDRLALLLVDYKGGSAFGDCVALPHCVGLVTDLDGRLVERALTSLRAELRRRERLLAEYGYRDIAAFEITGDPACPPSLVIVVDEFAALVAEVPAFVDGIVDLARRGRSLGIHLIMATQRPAGVIRENLRANTSLRIALRMVDPQDSTDVVGVPIASGFSPATPGRAVVSTGSGRRTVFQAAHAGGGLDVAEPEVRIESLRFGIAVPWRALPSSAERPAQAIVEPTEAAALVAGARAAAAMAGIPAPRRPWLDPLPDVIDLDGIAPRRDGELVLGMLDVPAEQDRRPAVWRPDVDGHLAVYGATGSGKSMLLRSIAVSAVRAGTGDPVQVYGLDFTANGLAALAALPEVGAIIDGDDGERIERLVRMLRAECERRVVAFAAVGAVSLREYRASAGTRLPRILLLIDGAGALREAMEHVGSPVFPMLRQVMADGPGLGIDVALSADRAAAIPPLLAPSIGLRVILRLADEHEVRALGLPSDAFSSSLSPPPGRGVVDGLEFQAAVPGGSAESVAQAVALAALAERSRLSGIDAVPGVGRLPTEVASESLSVLDGKAVLGVADDTLGPIGIAPEGTFLIAGPPGSGRTTALLTVVLASAAMLPSRRFVHIGPGDSAARSAFNWAGTATTANEVAALSAALLPLATRARAEQLVLVIESAGEVLANPSDPALTELVRAARRAGWFIIAEGEVSTLLPSWPGLAELKRARRGLILHPEALEAEALLRTPVPRARGPILPGRGVLVEGGRARVLHMAMPRLGYPDTDEVSLSASDPGATLSV